LFNKLLVQKSLYRIPSSLKMVKLLYIMFYDVNVDFDGSQKIFLRKMSPKLFS